PDEWAGYASLPAAGAMDHDSALQSWTRDDTGDPSQHVEPLVESGTASASEFPAAYERAATSPFDSPVAGWGDTFSIDLPSRREPADAPFEAGDVAFLPASVAADLPTPDGPP